MSGSVCGLFIWFYSEPRNVAAALYSIHYMHFIGKTHGQPYQMSIHNYLKSKMSSVGSLLLVGAAAAAAASSAAFCQLLCPITRA